MAEPGLNVLLVEDDDLFSALVQRWVLSGDDQANGVCHVVPDMQSALRKVADTTPDVILLDLSLPDSEPDDTFGHIQNLATFAPIVVLTGNESEKALSKALRSGVQEFLYKAEVSAEAVRQALANAVERHKFVSRISKLALYDQLTGLPNRSNFRERLNHLAAMAKRGGQRFAVLYVDLDRFKQVNDGLGHDIGDSVLISAAARLFSLIRESDIACRLGGDEFVVLQTGIDAVSQVASLAARVVDEFRQPFHVSGQDIMIGVTVGCSVFGVSSDDADELLRHADQALSSAKRAGRDQFSIYDPHRSGVEEKALMLEQRLRQAVNQQAFHFHYQPVVDTATGRMVAMEALLRWTDDEFGPQPTGLFIPLLESRGWMTRLTGLCLHEAAHALAKVRAVVDEDIRVHVNLSPSQLKVHSSVDLMAKAIREAGIKPDQLVVELTEVTSPDLAETELNAAISRMTQQGICLAMDDFGTGFASLRTFQKFSFSVLKLDRYFVSRMERDVVAAQVVRSVLDLGRNIHCDVVCEGVETASEAALLRKMGAGMVQGYHYARPMPLDDLLTHLQTIGGFPAPAVTGDAPDQGDAVIARQTAL